MLPISGFPSTNQTFTAAVAFLSQESTGWYSLALEAFLDLVDPSRQLRIRVVITDREPALIKALEDHLPNAYRLTCLWHLDENVKVNTRSPFDHVDDSTEAAMTFRNRFLSQVARATTETEMKAAMDAMDADYTDASHQRALQYVRGQLNFKERFVAAVVDEHPHLGLRNFEARGQSRLLQGKIGVQQRRLVFGLGCSTRPFEGPVDGH